ncbi:MAG: hypothetical protein NTW09_01945 [Candidatus Omnitrophica bacterium]|nr:hypothetical protein [Candidatus Omnitrophota bacterium]
MKKKFESNVAAEIPKTKLHEPELPWKITADDLAQATPKSDDYRSAVAGTPPFKTRAIFLILLVAALFLFTSIVVLNAVVENDLARRDMLKKEKELALIKTDLEKLAGEKEALTKNSASLEKKVSDLAAQKELFTSVIESLTKKSDEAEVEKPQTN